jgi:hypothetical protein
MTMNSYGTPVPEEPIASQDESINNSHDLSWAAFHRELELAEMSENSYEHNADEEVPEGLEPDRFYGPQTRG